jgi:flotillin
VADESETSLTGQGLVLDTFQIQDITDDGSYLSDLGRPESAKVGRRRRSPRPTPARGRRAGAIAAEQEIAIATGSWPSSRPRSRPRRTPRRARLRRRPAGPGRPRPGILQEQEKVAVAQAALKERQLDTEVRRPADAERYRVERRPSPAQRGHLRGRRPQGRLIANARRRPRRRA